MSAPVPVTSSVGDPHCDAITIGCLEEIATIAADKTLDQNDAVGLQEV